MSPAAREKLRVVIGVALAIIPAKVRRAYTEKPTGISEPAKRAIADDIAAAIEVAFEVEEKPAVPVAPSTQSFSPARQ